MKFDWSSHLKPSGSLPSLSQLQLFEADLGFFLPDDYREFLLTLNGGKVLVDHDIFVSELYCDVSLNCLWPLTKESPSLGILEARDVQVRQRLALRQAIRIGDDMGTGFFFLILDGKEKGSVYFGFKDDLPMREGDWYSTEVCIPDCMVKISQTFSDLGRTIVLHKLRG